MKTALEIYKHLPKTNCGKCGVSSCFGLAAVLASSLASPDDCPFLSENAREALRDTGRKKDRSPGTVYGQALDSLRPRVRALDFGKIVQLFGVRQADADTLEVDFLNGTYRVTKDKVLDAEGSEPRPWISILIYNHLCMPDPPAPAGEWITFSSVPASHAKDKAWAGHVEDVIAKHFAGRVEPLREACQKNGGRPARVQGNHDVAYEFRFFPRYPVLLLFDDAVPDEDFPAQCKLLLDKTAPRYLDIESMVVLGEEFAAQLTAG